MKRVIILALAVGLIFTGMAQKKEKTPPKPNLNKAISLLRQGKFDEAKEIVDGVPTHEKTMNDDKSWFVRGLVYAAMDTSSAYTGSKEGLVKTASEAFNKAYEISGPKSMVLSVVDNGESLFIDNAVSSINNRYLMTGD
jgi:hypothetical protein